MCEADLIWSKLPVWEEVVTEWGRFTARLDLLVRIVLHSFSAKTEAKNNIFPSLFLFFLPKVHLPPTPKVLLSLAISQQLSHSSRPLSRANKQSCRPRREGWLLAHRVQLVSISRQDWRDDRQRCWDKSYVWILSWCSHDNESSHCSGAYKKSVVILLHELVYILWRVKSIS